MRVLEAAERRDELLRRLRLELLGRFELDADVRRERATRLERELRRVLRSFCPEVGPDDGDEEDDIPDTGRPTPGWVRGVS